MKAKIVVELISNDKDVSKELQRLLAQACHVRKPDDVQAADLAVMYFHTGAGGLEHASAEARNILKNTSIPAIVISDNPEMKMSALQAGAVAFQLFPAEWADTLLVMNNLYKATRQGKKIAMKQVRPKSEALRQAEDRFLQEIRSSVENNLSNSHYNLATLCKDVHMSYSQLNRKFKTLRLKPSLYLRSLRLQYAYDYLLEGGRSIAEISYKVGFNSPAYFTKCFREEYGLLPNEVKKAPISQQDKSAMN